MLFMKTEQAKTSRRVLQKSPIAFKGFELHEIPTVFALLKTEYILCAMYEEDDNVPITPISLSRFLCNLSSNFTQLATVYSIWSLNKLFRIKQS